MRRLSDISFLDMYLGQDSDGNHYADIKGLTSVSPEFTPADNDLAEEIREVRRICQDTFTTTDRREFSFLRDGVLYRVATFVTAAEGTVFTLRQKKREQRKITELGLSMYAQEALLRKDIMGAVLIVGSMSSGKTTTMDTAIRARLEMYGGLALVLEDPIETALSGKIGRGGRALQIEVDQSNGGYTDELTRGMRSNAGLIMIGEIRDGRTAFDFLLGGSNGHLIISGIHGTSIEHGLMRLSSLTEQGHMEISELMSQGLSMVIHQSIVRSPRSDGQGYDSRVISQALVIEGVKAEGAIRSKIKAGNFAGLRDDIKSQQAANSSSRF